MWGKLTPSVAVDNMKETGRYVSAGAARCSELDSLHVFNDVDPTRTAHIVVDLQNGFMAPGQPAEMTMAREIVSNVDRISAAALPVGLSCTRVERLPF